MCSSQCLLVIRSFWLKCRIAATTAIYASGAMFAPPPWMGTTTLAEPPVTPPPAVRGFKLRRSRTPTRPGAAGHRQDTYGRCAAAAESVSGFPVGDHWFDSHVTELEIREDFFSIPQWKRTNIIIKCMDKPPENVHSWLASCIRNNKLSEVQKRIVAAASVHGGGGRFTVGGTVISTDGNTPPDARRHNAHDQSAVPAHASEPVGRLAIPANDRRVPAAWTADVLAAWPDKKSRLIQQFLCVLTQATQAKVLALAPAMQACIAMGVALHIWDCESPDALTTECLRRLQGSTPGRALSATESSMSPRSAPSSIQLQLIFVASEAMVPLVMAKCFTSTLDSLCPGAFIFLPLVIISVRDGPSVAPEAERLKLSIYPDTTSLATLETFIENSKANFKKWRIKTVFVSMIEAVNGVGVSAPQRNVSTLHSDSYRFLWTVARCSQLLRSTAGDNAVCDLVFAPSKLEEGLKQELGKMVGPMASTANVSYNHVAPSPSVFCTPGGSAIVPVCRKDLFATQELDGWRLSGEPKVTADIPGGLISYISRASEIGVFQERALTTLEQSTIDNFTMTHQETGEKRLVAREWWIHWFGYDKTPMVNLVNTQFPCHSRIYSVTGTAVATCDSAGGEPCGRTRYCVNCEKAFAVLDSTYSLPVMVDSAAAMMIKARQLWSSGQDDQPWIRSPDVNRTHMCGASCTFLN